MGREHQPRFINACIEIETSLDPHALLSRSPDDRTDFGRDRASEQRWGPRPLDLDLIAYDDVSSCNEPELTLPHPHLFERAFVLVPLAEIAPDRLIAGRRVTDALASYRPRESSGCRTWIRPKQPFGLAGRPWQFRQSKRHWSDLPNDIHR